MLSRVADALYWMGRYLERAENLTRLLLVTEDTASEVLGLDEDLALAEWQDLQRIFPGPEMRRDPDRPPPFFAFAYLHGLALEPGHPYSIHVSLKKARDNARAVREALTVEVFVSLNDTWRDLETYTHRPSLDAPMFRDALSRIHRGILSTVGAIEHTLTRDQGWLFLKMGESLERVLRTATVLRVKLPPRCRRPSPSSTCRCSTAGGGPCCAGSPRWRTTGTRAARASSPPTSWGSCSSPARRPAPCTTAPPP